MNAIVTVSEGKFREELSALINKRHFHEASRLASDWFSHNCASSAHTYFQISLAFRLKGDNTNADVMRRAAERCDDYTAQVGHDFDRDEILAQIKNLRKHDQGKRVILHNQITALIKRSKQFDRNRQAIALMVDGRYWMAISCVDNKSECFTHALEAFNDAHDIFASIPQSERNVQWEQNNRFHNIIAFASDGNDIATRRSAEVFIKTGDPSRKKRLIARTFFYSSEFGPAMQLVAWLVRRFF